MKKSVKILISLALALALAVSAVLPSFATKSAFSGESYADVVTVSDLQAEDDEAFDRFGKILGLMKKDGLETPDSVLVGGDYSKTWPDYATPGVAKVKNQVSSVYADADTDSVICIQGNHDFLSSGFVKSGFYDMGAYCLYAINEDSFPWNQFLRPSIRTQLLAEKVEEALNGMIESGDKRPVIIMTHVPLHHTSRTLSGDNKYSSYLFNVINEAAKNLDIVFIFGHNHSGDYDDYIGGSVNFLTKGDTIRIPLPNKIGDDCYTEETLNFTYTNCGYAGYSNNGTENGSTDVLTAGVIRIFKDRISFVRYTEEGLLSVKDITRVAPCSTVKERTENPAVYSESFFEFEISFIEAVTKAFSFIAA